MTDATAANVLLVDDEADFSQTLAKRLRRRGLQVVVAGNGHDGLAALDRAPADVVLLDVRMPGLDGIETLREMKKRHPLTEVIMLTGHASVESGLQGMALGAYDYVMKPADLDELVEKLRKAHERKIINARRG